MSLDYDAVREARALRPSWTVGLLTARAVGDLTKLDADFLAVIIALADRGYLRARVGYRRTFTFESGRDLSEQRVIVEITPRGFLPGGLLVALRNRLDLRWLEGDPSWRYRPRLWLERESRIGPVTVVPYGAAEVFFDSRFDDWIRTRYQAGIAVPATGWLVPEMYYARQIDDQPVLQYTNALGMVVTLYF